MDRSRIVEMFEKWKNTDEETKGEIVRKIPVRAFVNLVWSKSGVEDKKNFIEAHRKTIDEELGDEDNINWSKKIVKHWERKESKSK